MSLIITFLQDFSTISTDFVKKKNILKSPSKTCLLDPMPSFKFNIVLTIIVNYITYMQVGAVLVYAAFI